MTYAALSYSCTLNRWQNCCNRQQTIQGQEKLSMIAPYHVYAHVVLRLQRAEMFMTPALKNMCIWLSATVGLPIRNPLKRYGTALHKVYCNAQYDVFESHTNRSGVHNLQVHCSTLVMETSLHLFLQKPNFTVISAISVQTSAFFFAMHLFPSLFLFDNNGRCDCALIGLT